MTKLKLIVLIGLMALVVNAGIGAFFLASSDSKTIHQADNKNIVRYSSAKELRIPMEQPFTPYLQTDVVEKQDVSPNTQQGANENRPTSSLVEKPPVQSLQERVNTQKNAGTTQTSPLSQTNINAIKEAVISSPAVKENLREEEKQTAFPSPQKPPLQQSVTKKPVVEVPKQKPSSPPKVKPEQETQSIPDPKVEPVKTTPVQNVSTKSSAVKKLESVHISYNNNVLILRVTANQAVKAKSSYVGNPERAILDLIGKWNIPSLPPFPANPYSKGIRTGLSPNQTRFVIDITTKKFERSLVQNVPNVVELIITFSE